MYVCTYNRVPSVHRLKLIVRPRKNHSVYQTCLLSSCVFSSLEQQVVRVGRRKGSGFQPGANILGEGVRWGKRVTDEWCYLGIPVWTHCAYEPTAADVAWTMGWGAQQWRGADSPRAFVTLPRMRTVTFTSPTTYQTTLILHNTSNRHPPLSAFFIPPNKAVYLSLHFAVHFYIPMIVHMKYPSFVASS